MMMNHAEFRALLTWRMVSDPMPEATDLPIVDGLLNREAVARGYADWVDAYHCFMLPAQPTSGEGT